MRERRAEQERRTERSEHKSRARTASDAHLAREAWALFFELMHVHIREFPQLAAECELSSVQAHVLRLISPETPVPMSAIAEYLSCDASNVTGLVDRLEARGLIERQSSEHDRRVKMLALTDTGAQLRTRLMERLADPPAFITTLSREDLNTLKDVMHRALSTSSP
jgi:DNA-binding MarR family transcriptional regulator